MVYGPLANGASIVMYEGAPDFPQRDRFWEIIDRYKVTIFYSSATAVRAFMAWGMEWINAHELDQPAPARDGGRTHQPGRVEMVFRSHRKESLPHRGYLVANGNRLDPDFSAARRHAHQTRLGHAAASRRDRAKWSIMKGEPVGPGETGYLTIQKPWPSMLRTIYGDDERYAREYWSRIPGVYFAGDAAQCDKDGYIWVLGRVDDVIKVAGHRLSSMEIESVLVSHPSVAEAAVVARPDEIKGEAIVCFVTLRSATTPGEELRAALMEYVANTIGSIARPADVRFARPAAQDAQRQNHAPPSARTSAPKAPFPATPRRSKTWP